MRKPSEKLFGLLNRLHARPNLLLRLTNPTAPLRDALTEIAKAGEPAAIPNLIPFAFHTSADVASAASETIHRLFRAVADADLIWLDEQIRSWSFWPRIGRWGQMQAHDVANIVGTNDARTTILGIITCHRDGRVRQEAVSLLGNSSDREAIPFLLLRANDWVSQVRTSAQNIICQWRISASCFDWWSANAQTVRASFAPSPQIS